MVNLIGNPYAHLPTVPAFAVSSNDVRDGEQFPLPFASGTFGAGGGDISPQLSWHGFPAATKSFVVTMFDANAPTPSGFWHWAVVDIPATVTELSWSRRRGRLRSSPREHFSSPMTLGWLAI